MTVKILLLILTGILTLAIILIVPYCRVHWALYAVSFIVVVGNVFYPIWLYQGIQKMGYITSVGVTSRIITTCLIFALVKGENDYLTAACLQSLGPLLSGLFSIFILKYGLSVNFRFSSLAATRAALREGWNIFASSALTSLLASSGVIVLGLFQPSDIVGEYSALDKLIKAAIGLFSPITQAVFPHISKKFSQSYAYGRAAVLKSLAVLGLLGVIVTVGIMICSKPVLDIMYGKSFEAYATIFDILSIWLLLSVINNVIGIQYLVGLGKDRSYSKAMLISSMITVLLLLVTVPLVSIYGVAVAMCVGEIVLSLLVSKEAVFWDRSLRAT